MRLSYDSEADALYVTFDDAWPVAPPPAEATEAARIRASRRPGPVAKSEEIEVEVAGDMVETGVSVDYAGTAGPSASSF